jgi:predicted phage-related endonuclease
MKMTLQKALSVFQFGDINLVNTNLLKKSYLDLAQVRHPDKGGTTDEFIELKDAYTYLKKFLSESSTDNYSNYTYDTSAKSDKTTYKAKTTTSSNSYAQNQYQIDKEYVRQLESVNAELTEQNKSYYAVMMNYEGILNKEIEVFNKINTKLTKLANEFNANSDKNKLERDKNIEELKKQYSPAFKDLINPFQRRIDNEEYMWRHNSIIQDYEEKKMELESTFLNAMVEVYQVSFEQISDLLEKNT